jgi:DNA-directed RNA polymerase subunit RPC12/RpoP
LSIGIVRDKLTVVNRGECIIEGCNKKQRTRNLCPMHYRRLWINGSPYITRKRGMPNKGLFPYPRHGDFKYNSKLKAIIENYRCEICGKYKTDKRFHTHHIDFDKSNHSLYNLIYVCVNCHAKLHWKHKKLNLNQKGETLWLITRAQKVLQSQEREH